MANNNLIIKVKNLNKNANPRFTDSRHLLENGYAYYPTCFQCPRHLRHLRPTMRQNSIKRGTKNLLRIQQLKLNNKPKALGHAQEHWSVCSGENVLRSNAEQNGGARITHHRWYRERRKRPGQRAIGTIAAECCGLQEQSEWLSKETIGRVWREDRWRFASVHGLRYPNVD